MPKAIHLSTPHIGQMERQYVDEACQSNWIACVGYNVDAFEQEFAAHVGSKYAVALNSGTAALHLALIEAGIGLGDEVLVSDFTFCASVNPILYQGGIPIFIGSEADSWNLDPHILEDVLRNRANIGKIPKALVLVHLYGQSANWKPIQTICEQYGVTIIEDAAEALGATYHHQYAGTLGAMGIFSFNGNKIITTSGGGMLVTNDEAKARHIQKLATQAKDIAPHYQHSEIGYNYRLSNILAGIGRGQLTVLDERIQARRANFRFYQSALQDVQGIEFMPEATWGVHTRWLSCLTFDPQLLETDKEKIRLALRAENIEARPLWKPMHLQPIFSQYEAFHAGVEEKLFETGLCLPSGSNLEEEDLGRITDCIYQALGKSVWV